MAKSKSGGTRAYIRGKIGADVYSIGKDGKGAKQQVVRSLAEVVSNPQTVAQMRGRMIMSTVMQTVSALSPIIDHSFDNVPNGQPSISEFISRNYALVKADVAAHPASGTSFGINKYQEKGSHGGLYVISSGKVAYPSVLSIDTDAPTVTAKIAVAAASNTYGAMKESLGLANGDYLTIVAIDQFGGGLMYARLYLKADVADTTVISADTVATLFDIESSVPFEVTFADNAISISSDGYGFSAGVILSKKTNEGWEHSTSKMVNLLSLDWTADVALPTYPQGASRFLNGGDI